MAPEIFKRSAFFSSLFEIKQQLILCASFPVGHGKPVDIWAIGVITYFLLCGYTPFDRDSQQEEMQAIVNRDFKFEPRQLFNPVVLPVCLFLT